MLLLKHKYGSMLHLTLFLLKPFVVYPFPVLIEILVVWHSLYLAIHTTYLTNYIPLYWSITI